MNVVHVCKVSGIAGAERHLLHLLPALAARGVEVRIIVIEEPGRPAAEFCDAMTARGISAETVPVTRHVDPWLVGRLVRRFAALSPDLVHTHLLHADLYGLRAARRAGIRATVSSRHDNNPFRRGWFMRGLTRRAMRDARHIVAISHALARFCVDVEGADPRSVVTIHYGLDAEPVDPSARESARAALGWHGSGPLVGVVGRLVAQKGIDVLLDAFTAVRRRHSTATLLVVGDGPLRDTLQKQSARLGLESCVRFAGWIAHAKAIMPAVDVMVMPSRWEGLGLAALEAMASARPLVASDVDALPEIVRHEETGLLVPAEDPASLAAAINALLDRPERAAELGANGRQRVLDHFSVQKMTQATIDLYTRTIDEARA